MNKINILVVPSDKFGSGKYRSVDPHINLSTEEFFVDINYTPDWNDDEYLKNFDIVHLHRHLNPMIQDTATTIEKLKSMGVKVIVDTDDYWQVDTHHSNYQLYKKLQITKHILAGFKAADMITVPTQFIANELKNIGIKHVTVLPNAINTKEDQFITKPTDSELLRFGWLGGSSHALDVELLKTIPYKGQPFQTVLCGFDTRGKKTVIDSETKEQKQVNISPLETVWFSYEVFLTDGYKTLENDDEYKQFLFSFKDIPYPVNTKPYSRYWTRAVNAYAKNYNNFDVSLAPLKDTKFNLYKSQLKVIEAGFMKKALIASNYGPYTIDLIHGKNCLLVDPKKNHKQWRQHVEKLVENPNMVKDLGEALYETVKDKYSLSAVNDMRSDLYKRLVNGG